MKDEITIANRAHWEAAVLKKERLYRAVARP